MMLGPMYCTFLEMLGVAVRMLKSLISVFFFSQVPPKKGSDGKSARKKRRSSFAQGRKKRKSLAFSSVPLKKAG